MTENEFNMLVKMITVMINAEVVEAYAKTNKSSVSLQQTSKQCNASRDKMIGMVKKILVK